MIKVFQIQLTDEEVNLVNTIGWDASPRTKAFADRSFDSTFKEENFKYYDHVATLEVDDMDEAFELMNLWDREYLIERMGPCSSMSVGDILEMENGDLYRCASWGFTKLSITNIEDITA